ncbi:hypothetical protein LN042_03335 [Kitasatospora sp. RB6PN24]|uniref:hypothetical protein n=1 Tax=Kitasatospora humi TaxID=2893891 RepID=UPI001E44A243|nr:hypothetical protein [Kitasatospora humi]MCC9306149.1 hypothetical protein [Kitasatospora humi]
MTMTDAASAVAPPTPLLWFSAPVGFVEVPLEGTAEERLDRLAAAFDAIGPDVPREQRLDTAVNAELLLQAQLAQGLVYLANCIYRTDDGEVIHAVFTIVVTRTETGGPLAFATQTTQRWAAARPQAEVGVLDLPCGRAAVATEDRLVTVPGELYGLEGTSESLVRQIEVAIPHPDGQHVALVVLSTEHLAQWADWATVVGTALRELSFQDPLTALPQQQSRIAHAGPGPSVAAAIEDRIRRAFG